MKKKGFTLVEIIICLVLIVLISTITIIIFQKKTPNKEKKSKQELENAGEVYIEEAVSNKTYKSYEITEDNPEAGTLETKNISCLSPDTLIEKGYITNDNEYYKYLKENRLYLKVVSSSVGSIVYY